MNSWMNKVFAAHGSATTEVGDAIAFLGYFGGALVAGGVSYNNAYDKVFRYELRGTEGFLQAATDFSVNVLLNGWCWPLALVLVLAFAFVFYCSRFVWNLLVGYLVLSSFLLISILCCILLGDWRGRADARGDKLGVAPLPEVALSFAQGKAPTDAAFMTDSQTGAFHLLWADGDRVVVFKPVADEDSLVRLYSFKRDVISQLTITLKPR